MDHEGSGSKHAQHKQRAREDLNPTISPDFKLPSVHTDAAFSASHTSPEGWVGVLSAEREVKRLRGMDEQLKRRHEIYHAVIMHPPKLRCEYPFYLKLSPCR